MADRRYALLGHVHAASGTAWGGITGTLADQTDLQTALDAKAATSHTHSLTDVTDVTALAAELNLLDLSGLTAGWVLSADTASTASWKAPAGGGASALADLSDVVSATNTNRFALMANGTTGYVGRALVEADISDLGTYLTDITGEALSTLSDVTLTAIASGELLKWNGSAWINNTLAEAGVAAASHTHVAANITDFDTEVANNTAVALNTAKVTNATHTGDVTGSGALTIAAGAVDIAMLANGTDGELITWSAAGAPTTVAVGTATHVLTSNGTGAAPTFQAAAGGGFTPKPVMYVGSGSGAISATTAWVTVDLATEYYDTETNYSLATDVITVTDAGYYLISYVYTYHPTGGATNDSIKCRMTKNGTTTVLPGSTTQSLIYKSNTRPSQVTGTFLASLAASDTVRLQQACESGTTGTELGTSINVTLVKVG